MRQASDTGNVNVGLSYFIMFPALFSMSNSFFVTREFCLSNSKSVQISYHKIQITTTYQSYRQNMEKLSASSAFVTGIHQSSVDFPHKDQ